MERGIAAKNGRGSLINADGVHKLLSHHGFQTVDMATLPLHDQTARVGDAEMLAGPHGAAFVHALFMQPRSKVIECFSPNYINPSILPICKMLRHDYQMLVHPNAFDAYGHGNELKIKLAHLELALQRLA